MRGPTTDRWRTREICGPPVPSFLLLLRSNGRLWGNRCVYLQQAHGCCLISNSFVGQVRAQDFVPSCLRALRAELPVDVRTPLWGSGSPSGFEHEGLLHVSLSGAGRIRTHVVQPGVGAFNQCATGVPPTACCYWRLMCTGGYCVPRNDFSVGAF